MRLPFAVFIQLLVALVGAFAAFDTAYVEFGTNLGDVVPSRITALLSKANVKVLSLGDLSTVHEGSLVLSFGNGVTANKYVNLTGLSAEGYALKSANVNQVIIAAANGLPMSLPSGRQYALDVNSVHYGAVMGSYALLEQLGFAFVHPLQSHVPSGIALPEAGLDIQKSPRWPTRTWHVHTQHPLEFHEVLNGFDIPMFETGFHCPHNTYCESFDDMLPSLSGLFEWAIANGQNRIESLLLGNKKWEMRDESMAGMGPTRQARLKRINDLAHSFGMLMGADIPIAFMQQHAWAMVSVHDDVDKQVSDINARVDWAMEAGFDFLSTESGLSEFTKPSCDLMLTLFNAFSSRVSQTWHREAYTKVHCSTNEFCTEKVGDSNSSVYKYPDPRNPSSPINFNLLPTYADDALGVLVHTIQVYSFDDPSAGAYGNSNFSYMSDYMMYESGLKRRDVLYYAESAYWVNVDIDVPLFLPLSGQRRLYDLRRTARLESSQQSHIQGQMNFESGWEFGYWISNTITARAVYDPLLEVEGDEWEAFRAALAPVGRIFASTTDSSFASRVVDAIISFAQLQADVMVDGNVDGLGTPADISKLSGHAYLSGADTWVDLPRMLGIGLTQPDKIHIHETDDPQWGWMMSLLAQMDVQFGQHYAEWTQLVTDATDNNLLNQGALGLLQELADSVGLVSLRASQVHALYLSADPSTSVTQRKIYLQQGRDVLKAATAVVDRRKDAFRVTPERIASWRENPTVYPYGYVWAATSLYYWWRDQGQAEAASTMAAVSPCYLNRMEPAELVFGWGKAAEQALRLMLLKKGYNDTAVANLLADCLAPPLREIKFPQSL